MSNKQVILLDEYDFYKAGHDSVSRNFLKEQDLIPVLIDSEEGLQITGGENCKSGTIMVQSPIKNDVFYGVINATQQFRDEFWMVLVRWAPSLGIKKITFLQDIKNYEESISSRDRNASINTTGANIDINRNKSENNSYKYSHEDEKSREFENGKVTKEEILIKLNKEAVNYKNHQVLAELIDGSHYKTYSSEIKIIRALENSKKIITKLEASGGLLKIPILKQISADYRDEIKEENKKISEEKMILKIEFH